MRFGWVSTLIAGAAVACLLSFSASAGAATRTVENPNDSGSGSLRAVITGAEGGDTIVFDPSLDGQTINLTSGAIGIDESLTIEGPGASELTIDAGQNSQIFTMTAGSLSISGLTLAGGVAPEEGGAIYSESTGSLSVSDCVFSGNTAGEDGGAGAGSGIGHGGAIYASFSAASLAVSDCSFTGNAAGGDGGSGERGGRGRGGAIDYHGAGALTISNSSFTGNAAGGDGEVGPQGGLGRGGAIFVSEFAASTALTDSTFTGNTAGGNGGAGNLSGRGEGGVIQGESGTGTVTITGSTFTDNVAGGRDGAGAGSGAAVGGAIESFSSLTITDSTFTGNAAGGQGGSGEGAFGFGGAIHNFNNVSPLTVTGSTFVDNSAGGQGGSGTGGAIDATSVSGRSASITNSTFVGNAAGGGGGSGSGGAIEVVDMTSVTLASVTIDENEVGAGGSGAGINSTEGAITDGAAVTAKATIVSGNTGASNCDVPVASSSYSLEGPSSGEESCGFSNLSSADPELEALADNGGPTETQALPATSPAVDVVPVAKCPTKVDQRGEPRPDNGKVFCDVGAYELQGPDVPPVITSAAAATFQVGKQGGFTVKATGLPAPQLSEAGALPKGVAFTDNGDGTASLSGKPANGTGGSYPITIKASNGTLPDDEQSFTLTVQEPPTASIAVPAANVAYAQGQAVASSFTCKEGVGGPGIASCVDQDGHPSGAALDTAKTGKHTFTVTATSSDGLSNKAKVTYQVVAPKPAPLAVSILSGRAPVIGGVAKVRLSCNGGTAKDACRGKLSLTRRGRELAHAGYKIASGQTQLVSLRLNKAGLRSLRHAHRHRLRVTASAGGGVHRTILLKLKRQAKRT